MESFSSLRQIKIYESMRCGKPVRVLQMPGGWILSPQFLPDGKRFLFCVYSGAPRSEYYIASLDESAPKQAGAGGERRRVASTRDCIVFVQQEACGRGVWISNAKSGMVTRSSLPISLAEDQPPRQLFRFVAWNNRLPQTSVDFAAHMARP